MLIVPSAGSSVNQSLTSDGGATDEPASGADLSRPKCERFGTEDTDAALRTRAIKGIAVRRANDFMFLSPGGLRQGVMSKQQ